MKNRIKTFIPLLVFLIISSAFSSLNQKFSSDDYSKYDWEAFYQLQEANEKIDLRDPDYELLDAAIFYATNEQRVKKRMKEFKFSETLHSSAKAHSNSMVQMKFFEHKNPKDKKNRLPHDRIRNAGGKYLITGENIAMVPPVELDEKEHYQPRKKGDEYIYLADDGKTVLSSDTYLSYARKVVDGWMHSPPHRANILDKDFMDLGVGVKIVDNPYSKIDLPQGYSTQNFGR